MSKLTKETNIKIVRATALNPKKQYILIFNKGDMTWEIVKQMGSILNKSGIKCLSVVIDGDPKAVKIIEVTSNKPTKGKL